MSLPTPYYVDDFCTLYHGDCREILPLLADASVDLVLTDPPYFRVVEEAWDRAWSSADAFLSEVNDWAAAWQRLLKANGSLYCFTSPQMSARVQVTIAAHLDVLNEIVWVKNTGRHQKAERAAMRSYFPQTERIVFAEQYGSDGSVLRQSGYGAACQKLHAGVFEPLRQYLVTERDAAGITNRQVDVWLGTNGMAGHYFGASQWSLPTAEHYASLQVLFNKDGADAHLRRDYAHLRRDYAHLRRDYDDLRRDYDDLRRDYDDLRRDYDDLRRPFQIAAHQPTTDVWGFDAEPGAEGRHPTAKPLPLIANCVTTSSRPNALVLDPFAGSGTTLVAAKQLGRRAIGIELEERYCAIAARRLSQDVLALGGPTGGPLGGRP